MTTEQEILELKTELTLERERHTKASGKDQTFNEWWSGQKKDALFPEIYTTVAEEWAFSGWHAGCLESWSGQDEPENPSMPYKNCEHWEDVLDRCRISGTSCERANGEECEDYRPLCRVCSKPLTNPDHVVCSQKCSDAESR